MTRSQPDLQAAADLRRWVEGRSPARKRARSVMAAFGRTNFTQQARADVYEAMQATGLESTPSVLDCERDDWLRLAVIGEATMSDTLPSQLVAWHEFNWTGDTDGGHCGEWLRCMKNTRSHARQFIWSGASVAGIVTFAGWVRPGPGFYEGWGSLSRMPAPIDHARLLADERVAKRFDARGIKALQGSPIGIDAELARVLSEMLGGLPSTPVPLDEPDYNEEPVLWAGLHGLSPEAHIEAAVATRKQLWRKLGFPTAPARQRRLGTAGRVDLIAGDVVGEAKRAVTVRDGPDQIERYLSHLELERRRPRSRLRGVLLQCAAKTTPHVADRIETSPYRLELWSVTSNGRWRLKRLA